MRLTEEQQRIIRAALLELMWSKQPYVTLEEKEEASNLFNHAGTMNIVFEEME